MLIFNAAYGKTHIVFLFFICLPIFISGCLTETKPSSCVRCHKGIEHVSKTHGDCVSCHGGKPLEEAKEKAHQGVFGIANPEYIGRWENGCAPCHKYQFERMKSNLMYTAAGMIRNTQLTWEGEDGNSYTAHGEKQFDAKGKPFSPKPVAELDNLSGELYRKFCAQCHVGSQTTGVYGASHASGCAACHFPWNNDGVYSGNDKTMAGKVGHSASHAMTATPDTNVCTRCHNRSGRIALSYQGLYDGNSGLVPTVRGVGGPVMTSGNRNLTYITPDVHFAAGMECIDCHTSRDVMGDGYAYQNMYLQTEIACEDCHGGIKQAPQYRKITRENDEALRESKNYQRPLTSGMKMIQTSKGRSYSNVFYQDNKVWVVGKKSGKLHESKVITGTPAHNIVGHERLECYSCHSRSVPQCYGCHTTYDKELNGYDFIKHAETTGAFSETEDYRMLYPFPLALNQRGRISPVTPGCQTFINVIEPDGSQSKTEYVAKYKGKQQLRFAPFYSHNTSKKAVGCAECHSNPSFLGFGQHVVEGNSIKGTLICERSDSKPLDGFLTLNKGKVNAYSAITRENARPLNGAEVKKTLAVNLCIPCHDKPKDPIYRKELDYRALDDKLHRRLLTGG